MTPLHFLNASPPLPRRRVLRSLWAGTVGCGLLALTSCAVLTPNFRVSMAELNEQLAGQFPLDRRVLDVFNLHAESPELSLMPKDNRIGLRVSYRLRDTLFGTPMSGQLAFTSGLRIDGTTGHVHLSRTEVTQLTLDSAGKAPADPVTQRLGRWMAEQLLDNMVIYRMKPEQHERLSRAGLKLDQLVVASDGISLTTVAR